MNKKIRIIKDSIRKRGLWLLYCPLYFAVFTMLERLSRPTYLLTTPVDRKIPLLPPFVVPYLLWFPFVAAVFGFFFFKSDGEFRRFASRLYIGMTVFLAVSFIFPNRLDIRPAVLSNSNVFNVLLNFIWSHDTPTNVFPSIHVYNSVICSGEVLRSRTAFPGKGAKTVSAVLAVLIIFSTMFIKQHSVLDVAGAFLMAGMVDVILFQSERRHSFQTV